MSRSHWLIAATTLSTFFGFSSPLHAQEKKIIGGPRPGVRERVGAVERLMEMRTDESAKKFVEENLSATLRSSKPIDQWLADIKAMRQLYRNFSTVNLSPSGEAGLAINFGGTPGDGTPLLIEIDATAPHWITSFKIDKRVAAAPDKPRPPQVDLSWENLAEKLKQEAADGFSGAVLVVRDGAIVHNQGYGLANRDKKISNSSDTVFAIGSTPIDFTQGAILKLEDMGKLKTSDSIAKYLPNVPDDKKKMTLDDLMTGRSGLPNFLGRPQDADPDNTWIDRGEALKRILESDLLFEPGTEHAHSHAAFGVLAAVVELVSGDSYIKFLDKNLFGPAGMTKTGHYEDIKAKDDEVAIGYGGNDYTPVNSPKNWGKTSWLVLGSGGMVSTTGDLYRWNQGIRDGKLLSLAAIEKYFRHGGGVLVGGNMHGFYTSYTTAPDTLFFLCTNDIGREKNTEALTAGLVALVNKPKFRLGVSLRYSHEGVVVESVAPASPAARAGLQIGDKFYSINGELLGPHSSPDALKQQTSSGKPVELQIKRGEEMLTVTLTPIPG